MICQVHWTSSFVCPHPSDCFLRPAVGPTSASEKNSSTQFGTCQSTSNEFRQHPFVSVSGICMATDCGNQPVAHRGSVFAIFLRRRNSMLEMQSLFNYHATCTNLFAMICYPIFSSSLGQMFSFIVLASYHVNGVIRHMSFEDQ